MIKKHYSCFLFFLAVLSPLTERAATFYARANGNWNTASTWSTVSCSGAASASIPTASDNVIICSGRTVTMNGNPGACLSLNVSGTANWTSTFTTNVGAGGLTLNNSATLSGSAVGVLNVAGTLTQPAGATSTVGGITLNVTGTTTLSGTLNFNNAGGTKTFTNLVINAGAAFSSSVTETYTVTGNVTMNGGSLNGSSSGSMNIAGTLTISAGASAAMGNINISVMGLTSINGALTDNSTGGSNVFNNVDLNAGGSFNNTSSETYTINGDLNTYGGDFLATGATPRFNVIGNFNVVSGICDVSRIRFTISGTTTISGTLDINSVRGTKTFNNLIVTPTGTFNSVAAESYKINGNIQINGVLNANTGIWTFAGLGKTITGTTAMVFDDITTSGTYTNNASVKTLTSFKGTGTWSQGTTGTLELPISNGNFTLNTFNATAAGNTVIYSRSGNQNVILPDDGGYSNLTVSGGSTKSLVSNTIIGKNLLISASTTLDANNRDITIGGNFTNNNAFTPGTARVTFNGTSSQAITGTVVTGFNNLTISNAAGVTLGRNTTVAGILNFTAGVITTSANKVTIGTSGSVTGAGTGKFVNGFLEKRVATGTNVARTYEVGFGTSDYLPLNLLFASVSTAGNITAKANDGDHPSIATAPIEDLKSVNRYWSLTNSGTAFTNYAATCNFIGVGSDSDAGSVAANYYMSVFNASAWTLLTRGTVTATSNQGMAITTMGDLQVGERRICSVTIAVSPSSTICAGASTVFTATPVFGGATPSYQWQVNGVNVGTNSPTYTTTTLTNGQIVTCILTSSFVGILGSPATSNSITMTVNPVVPVSVSIAASPSSTICAGTNVTFTATPTNGGTTPAYQWQVNGVNVGTNSPTYSSSTLTNGQLVTCQLTSNVTCPSVTPALSNTITMVVNPVLTASVSISASTSSPICAGTNVIFTATPVNGGTTPAYQWTLNGANVGTNSATYSNSTLITGDVVFCTMTSNAPCVSVATVSSNTLSFTVTTSGTWLGAVSTNWNTAGNWCGGVPGATTDVIIPSGTAFVPQLTNASTCRNLTIQSGASLSLSTFTLNVKGDFSNSGTFDASSGTISFSGTIAQTIFAADILTFNNLTVNNINGVTITSGTFSLDGALTCSNGTFNTGGNSFTMTSSAGQTARIAPITGTGAIAGSFNVQRFISARDTSYSDLSSTVQATNFADWDNELPAISYVNNPPVSVASAFTYDETGDVYVPITSSTTALVPGKGYEVFLAGDYSYGNLPNTTINAVGVPNQGDFNLNSLISNNEQGWNLVGNPFASSISWASVYSASGSAASGLYDYVEMYDYTIGDWNGYTSADGIEIGSGQGFWVYGLPGATSLTLTIPESSKTTSSNSSIKSLTSSPFFNLTLANTQNSFAHTFKVAADQEASNGFDTSDRPFRASPNKATPALFSYVGGRKVNVNTFSSKDDEYSLPLAMTVSTKGKYLISASGFESMPEYNCIKLEDRLNDELVDLFAENTYEFETSILTDNKRFVLHFTKNGDCKSAAASAKDDLTLVEVLPYQYGTVLNFNYSEYTAVSISVTNVLGQPILPVKEMKVKNESEYIQLPSDFNGVYFIQIVSDKGNVVKKIYKN